MADAIRYEVADSIATITIDRPEKRGAMSFAILADFLSTVKRAAADDAARVVIVTGTEGSFCAGTDLADLSSIPGKQRGVRGEASDGDAWWPLVQCPKPVIGAIDGPAVGMGAEFTSQCDVRLASPRARFAWNFAKRGLVLVRYEGCEMEILAQCSTPGEYEYTAITRKDDRVAIKTEDDLWANVPLGAAALESKLAAADFYPQLFEEAFGTPEVSSDRISRALAQFVRSLVSYQSRYDEGLILRGEGDFRGFDGFDEVFTDQELLGLRLFGGIGRGGGRNRRDDDPANAGPPNGGPNVGSVANGFGQRGGGGQGRGGGRGGGGQCSSCHTSVLQVSSPRNNGLDAVTDDEILQADGVLLGTPVHWAMVSVETRSFLDRVGALLLKEGVLDREGRTAGAFCTGGGAAMGKEMARLTILNAFLTMRFVVVGGVEGDGFGTLGPEATTPDPKSPMRPEEIAAARASGERFARLTKRVSQGAPR